MKPDPRPTFNETLLKSLIQLESLIAANQGILPIEGHLEDVDYVVFASKSAGCFQFRWGLSAFP